MQGQQQLFDPAPYIVQISPTMTVRELAKYIQLRIPQLIQADGFYGPALRMDRKKEIEIYPT